MTNLPEAKLAREAEICYATVAMVTDYDCWHPGHANVTVDAIIKVLTENAVKARDLVARVIPLLGGHDGPCHAWLPQCPLTMQLITAPEARDPAVLGSPRCRCRAGALGRCHARKAESWWRQSE